MNKYTETFGIYISKDVFDCYGSSQGHLQFKNTEKGFVKFLQTLNDTTLVVMEATGYYHYRLAQFLYKQSVFVSVVNLLSVKRFIQMKLAKVKTVKVMLNRFVNMVKSMKFHYIMRLQIYKVNACNYLDG